MSYRCNEKGGRCDHANCIGCCTISACTRDTNVSVTVNLPMTNADRIRAMSDEELAEDKARYSSCPTCPIRGLCVGCEPAGEYAKGNRAERGSWPGEEGEKG